ncbi:MAG: methyl-accepting chemotaxis protein [Proteobacteria bacterium]|nr:methyl-accepting chemotaxis protein [Pseudomonadota bacterium]MBU1450109.1 methyl-accepting chemotaxis protein [Pseudomonadota bacterium]MBU2469443.1 methyl-accepting chemotaxis protein [Pseudomonadota bacterium]MBU2517510.1 methyl-accepting chemotaxis protein [Pseudomonadota bacterium]
MRRNETKRRRLYFYPGFQPSFVWGLGGAVLAAGLAALLSMTILLVVQGREVVPNIFPLLLGFNIIVVLGLLSIVYWVALFVSHRMGGPLYRMEVLFKDLGEGRLNHKVSLRRDDQLHHVAEALNQGVSGLRQRLEELRRQARQLEDVTDPHELREQAKLLGRHIDDLFVL